LVHGNHIEMITPDSPAGSRYTFPETDGLVTSLKNRPLFIPVADCTAIAFFDPKQQVIGMVHAGWKGAVNCIPQRMVEIMQRTYGCDPTDILVGISPGIGPCCYQVREDLVEIFTGAFPEVASRFFVPQPDDTVHLDMWTALRWQLEASGILPEHLHIAEICTACHTDEFYSHRAEHGKTGRFACLLALGEEVKNC
jgi:YfiH family protein